MRKILLVLLCAATIPASATGLKPLYVQDFSSLSQEHYKLGPNTKIENGKLICDRGNFELFFTSETPVKISFKVRELKIYGGADHHWGFFLTGGDGYATHIHTRGTGGIISLLTRNKGKVGAARGGEKLVISRGENTPWSTVDVYIGKKSFGISVDNESCIVQDVSFLPLKTIKFYSYRVKYEIDDLTITPLKEKPVKLIEKPVFSASFDDTLDAKDENGKKITPTTSRGCRFLPGVSGQGFSCVQDATPIGFKYIPKHWKITPEKEFLGEDGGVVDILVPALNDFVFETTFQRLGDAPKQDHHFNFGITSENKPMISFHSRNNTWWYTNKKSGQKKSFKVKNRVENNVDEKPVLFKLTKKDGKFTLNLDGQIHDLGDGNFGPVSKFTLNGYGVKYKLDDLKISSKDFTLEENFSTLPPPAQIPGISYTLAPPFSDKVGGVSFWIRSNDGKFFDIFNLGDGSCTREGKIFNAALNQGAAFNVKRFDSQKGLYYMRRLAIFPGDWFHVALTWEQNGNARLFVNGLPYPVCFTPGQRCPLFFNADLDGIKQLMLSRKGNFTLDELKFYHRPLSNNEIYGEYRSIMPIDLVMERSIIDGQNGEQITLQAAPGGYYMRPYPVPGKPFVNANVNMKLELFDTEGKLIKTENKDLKIDKPIDVSMESLKLPVGNYNLVATIHFKDKTFQRTFEVASFTEKVTHELTKSPYKLGKLIFEKEFSNPDDKEVICEGSMKKGKINGADYLEAGPKKRDRFSYVVSFPKELIGKPVILEIAWPDDKIRNMAFYMYKEAKGKQHRDRLQSGVQAGNEYPNSNKIEKAKYIFFVGGEHYLFEARTLAPDQPAAISSIRAYEIDGELPRLAIHYPKNMEGRHFGHFDEDQTFTMNLRVDNDLPPEFPRKTLMQNHDLMNYFDYTGQNTIHYPTWRYTYSFSPFEGNIGNGMYPGKPGELSYLFDSFHRHNKKYLAMINYFSLPDLRETKAIQYDFTGTGMVSLDRFGNDVVLFRNKYGNIANPKVREMFLDYFRDTIKRYANHPGFGGVEWWMNFGTWNKLDYGYDDYTVNAFSKATGIKVPEKITERYDFLTTPPVRDKWLKWRSEQVTKFIGEMRTMLDKYAPNLKLSIVIRQAPDIYAERGVDLKEIKKIKNISLTNERKPTTYRWEFHWGKPESTQYEEMYDSNSPALKDFLVDGSVKAVIAYNTYFESFNNSLIPKRFAAYFQNADPKQHGRFFLKEPAFAVGAMDALEFVIGGQPLGTLGRDEETREFTQAYCALPAKPFKTVPGLKDPAVVRYLNTPNGTYFYVVNMHHSPMKVKIDFGKSSVLGLFGGINYIDLSTDKELSDNVISLRPFQLRSFLIPDEEIHPISACLESIPPETDEFYQKRIADIQEAIKRLEKANVDTQEEKKVVATIQDALSKKEYAEAHRLSFSRRMNQVFQMVKDIKNIAKRQALIDQGVYRVNCGSTFFYEAPNGKFFFPDQKFDGLYGYEGSYNSVGRDIGKIKGTDMPEIFRTESYDISNYKFKVPNGTYKAILYIKCGYEPGFKKDCFEFSVKANGKMALYKLNLLSATEGDFNKALVVEIKDIEVTDNLLSLEFLYHPSATKKTNGTVRLANAIEIVNHEKQNQ